MDINGYYRADGTVGVRNYLLVISSVVCANSTVKDIARRLNGAVEVTHQHGCSQFPDDVLQTKKTLIGYGANPNVGACIVVGLGCETVKCEEVAEGIKKTGKPVYSLNIQDSGGTINTTSKGVEVGNDFLSYLSLQKRTTHSLSSITIGLECGGSDMASGITANPSIGLASDMLISHGGTSILSEVQELIGAEAVLSERAIDNHTKEKLLKTIKQAEQCAIDHGVCISEANPTPGNKEGGLSTIEEKSLGCVQKAGNAILQEVIGYADKPTKKGLIVMETPGQDVESITGMVAGGAQLVVFSTGRGTPVGCPIAPVIKVSSNTKVFEKMRDNIDINAGEIIDDSATIESVGEMIFKEVVDVINGKSTSSERICSGDFGIYRKAPSQ